MILPFYLCFTISAKLLPFPEAPTGANYYLFQRPPQEQIITFSRGPPGANYYLFQRPPQEQIITFSRGPHKSKLLPFPEAPTGANYYLFQRPPQEQIITFPEAPTGANSTILSCMECYLPQDLHNYHSQAGLLSSTIDVPDKVLFCTNPNCNDEAHRT